MNEHASLIALPSSTLIALAIIVIICMAIFLAAAIFRRQKTLQLINRVALTVFAIAVGVVVAIVLRSIHWSSVFNIGDGLVIDMIAAAVATGLTLSIILFAIQIPELNRSIVSTLQKHLFGVDDSDIQNVALSTSLVSLLPFSTRHAHFPIFLCNPPEKENQDPPTKDDKKISKVAMGLILGRPCSGDKIIEHFRNLAAEFKDDFQYVFLLDRKHGRDSIEGAIDMEAFRTMLRTKFGDYDSNIASGIAQLIEAGETEPLEIRNFITKRIPFKGSIAKAIGSMVAAKQSQALVVKDNGAVVGIAMLWDLVGKAYGYPGNNKIGLVDCGFAKNDEN